MAEANLGSATGRINIDASGAEKGVSDADRALGGFMGGLEQHSKTLDRSGKALLGIGTAAVGGLGLAVNTTAGFEQSMNRVGAVSGATGDEFEALKDKAKELGRTTAFSASEAADGMQFLAMAGFSTSETIDAMAGTLNLAAAGNLELAAAADIASNVISGYGLEAADAGRVSDLLASASANANTDVQGLGDAMKFVAPVASASGQSIEGATAAIGKLADAGIQGGMAGTTLRGIIGSLEKPTGEAATAIDRLGIEVRDSSGQLLPMVDIVRQFEEAGLSTADAMTIFGQRAGPGMMALVGQGADSLQELQTDLENSGGAAEEMANRQLEGLNGQLTMLKSAAEGAMIGIGEVLLPVVTRLAESFTNLVQRFANLSPEMQRLIAIGGLVGGVLAIVAGAALMILARLPMMIQGVQALGKALAFLQAGPIALILIAFAAIAAGLIWLYKNNETFRDAVQAIWARIQEIFQMAVEFIQGILVQLALWWAQHGDQVLSYVQTAFNEVMAVIRGAVTVIQAVIAGFVSVVTAFWNRFGNTIVTFWTNTWNNIKTVLSGAINVLRGLINFFIALFTGNWSGMGAAIRQIWNGLWQVVGGILSQAVNMLSALVSTLVNALIGFWNVLRDTTIRAWNALKDGAINAGRALMTFARELPGRIMDAFRDLPGRMLQLGKDIIQGMIDGIKNMAGNAVEAVKGVASDIWDQAKSFFKSSSPSKLMMELGVDIVDGLAIGIEKMADTAKAAARSMAEQGLEGFEPLTKASIPRDFLSQPAPVVNVSTPEQRGSSNTQIGPFYDVPADPVELAEELAWRVKVGH